MALRNLFGLMNLETTQSDNRTILDMILNCAESILNAFPRRDTNNRQCVRLEAIDASLTLGTVSTVTTVTTVSTVTSVSQLANMGSYSTQLIPFQASFPTHIYDRIVVS